MSYLFELSLQNFRNYDTARLTGLKAGFVVLVGPNGAGKTNILEAVSLLSPGRGLRSSKISDIQNMGRKAPWAVAGKVITDFGEVKIGTGRVSGGAAADKRKISIQGESSTQSDLGEYISALWLTPQMDGLFTDSTGERRRFFDRLAASHDPAHTGRIKRYENAMYQRSKLLKDDRRRPDPKWLSGLEAQMAEAGIAIAASRLDYLSRLTHAIDHNTLESEAYFPKARLTIKGMIEDQLKSNSAVEAEETFKNALEKARELDAVSGGASLGTHRSDFHAVFHDKDMDAAQSSTGEQKALLIGIVLAHSWLVAGERGAPPVLLLDEVSAHLDERRRSALYELLETLGGQIWLTGTEKSLFEEIKDKSSAFLIENGKVSPSAL